MKGWCGQQRLSLQHGPTMRGLHVQKPSGQGLIYVNEGDVFRWAMNSGDRERTV